LASKESGTRSDSESSADTGENGLFSLVFNDIGPEKENNSEKTQQLGWPVTPGHTGFWQHVTLRMMSGSAETTDNFEKNK